MNRFCSEILKRVVSPLPQQMSTSLVLDFATIYQCAIKPFKNLPQNRTVCILLLDNVDINSLPLSDAVCSNYTNGKRAIPDDYRTMLAKITEDTLRAKFESINIYNPQLSADAMRRLIDYVRLPANTYKRLLQVYQDSIDASTPLTFITEVFRCAADTKGSHPLSSDDLNLLASLQKDPEPTALPSVQRKEDGSDRCGEFSDEELQWMCDYIPGAIPITKSSFFGTSVTIDRQLLTLPHDYVPLVSLLKPALNGMPIDTFTFDDFIKCTGINPSNGKLRRGTLQCLKIVGPVDGIVSTIESLYLRDACSVVLLMIGRITITDAELIEAAIKKASNPKINFLRSLSFDSQSSDMEITLIVKNDPAEVKRMLADIAKEDGDVRIYTGIGRF